MTNHLQLHNYYRVPTGNKERPYNDFETYVKLALYSNKTVLVFKCVPNI